MGPVEVTRLESVILVKNEIASFLEKGRFREVHESQK